MAKKRAKKSPAPPKHHPLAVIRRARDMGIDSVIVAVSGGRDSVATLDLCREHFSRVEAFFMFFVRGLSFQERYLRYLENRYDLSILRLPHWALSYIYRESVFRHTTKQARETKIVQIRDIYSFVRRKFNIEFVATGEKCRDSLERNAQIVQADGINLSRKVVWPVAYWTHYDVQAYLARKQILPSPEYAITFDNKSFGSLWAQQIVPIAERFPEDYEKIKQQFPLIDAQVQRWKQMQGRKAENGKEEGQQQEQQSIATA